MAQYNHLPIFQLTYQLTLEIHKATHQFPKEYKYTIGQKLKEIVSDLLDMIEETNSKEEKTEILKEARAKLEQFRIHLRLCRPVLDTRCLTLMSARVLLSISSTSEIAVFF